MTLDSANETYWKSNKSVHGQAILTLWPFLWSLLKIDFLVAENAERGTIIGQIDISDLDQIDRGKLKLELHSTSDKISKHFGIDSAGRIFTTATLDRETESKYTFNILATDSIKPFHTAKVIFLTPKE